MIDKSIRSKNFLDKSIGIQGIEREKLVARLYVGKGAASLAKALKSPGTNDANLGERIEDLMEVKRGSLRKPFAIVTNFVHPPDSTRIEVGFGCLCGTGEEKLFAFIPHLQKHYDKLAKGIPSLIWVTYWSIEVAFPKGDGTVEWWDLRELTLDQIKNLDYLMAHGMTPSTIEKPVYSATMEPAAPAIPEAEVAWETTSHSPEAPLDHHASPVDEDGFGSTDTLDDDDFGF